MSSKNDILQNIKKHTHEAYDMPKWDIEPIVYPDKQAQFIEISKGVGGNAIALEAGKDINELIKELYPEAKRIASNIAEITAATFNPDEVSDPKEMNGTDLSVIRGEWGVAENGSVWIPQNVENRITYFISEYLVILLDKTKLVNTMHEAYENIDFYSKGFGVFISGPSKTADIEQALVVGAHGAKGVTVILV